MPTPITPVEISHAVDNTWTDIDVTAHVGTDAGNIAGVILQVANYEATENNWGVRKNGSTYNNPDILEDLAHTWVAIGVDGDDIFEAYLADASAMRIWLVGYITNDEGTFITNPSDVVHATIGSWTDIDLSAATGGDTAKVAFFLIGQTTTNRQWGLRENGSTDDRRNVDMYVGDLQGAMMAVDGSEIVEFYMENVGFAIYFVGYLTGNVTSFANAKDYATGTSGSYQFTDFGDDVPADNDGAFWSFYPTFNSEYQVAITKYGTTGSHDVYRDVAMHSYGWVELG